MKYKYNIQAEAFKREDNKGKLLYVNVAEAERIISLLNLGHSVTDIESKLKLSNPRGTTTTVKSFIKNYRAGNIIIPEDAPVPSKIYDEFVTENTVQNIEDRMNKLEEEWIQFQEEHIGVIPKFKRWLNHE